MQSAFGSHIFAPQVIKGTISLETAPGVIVGSGLTSDARIANGLAIQAAINSAISQNKFFEAPPGKYEFDLAGGLVIDADGFSWHGTRDTGLTQFHENTPVITLGRPVSDSNGRIRMQIDGLSAHYGVDQTGQTSANAIVMASSWMSAFRNISSGYRSGASSYPYRSIYFNGSGSGKWWFSNSLRDSIFGHAQKEIWSHNLLSTGCVYENIYIGGGAPTITPYTGSVMVFSRGGGRGQGSVFNQLNIEWSSGNHILELNNCRQYVFNSLHIEGCKLTGALTGFIYLNLSEVAGNGWDLENCQIKTADITSGTPRIIKSFGRSKATINSLRLGWLDTSLSDVNVDRTYSLYEQGGQSSGFGARCRITNFYIEGGGSYGVIGSIPTGDAAYPKDGDFIYDGNESYFEHGSYDGLDADITLYGSNRNPSISYLASLASNRTLVLSDKRGSSTWLSNAKVVPGSIVHLYRKTGTAVNTVTVKNLTSGGTTLATSSTADTEYRFVFDGTNWALAS